MNTTKENIKWRYFKGQFIEQLSIEQFGLFYSLLG